MSQEKAMSRIVRKFNVAIPPAKPTPKIAPTSVWVVEMGNPSLDAKRIVKLAANSAENPLEGVSSVIFLPMVSITFHPYVARPKTMPKPPKINILFSCWRKEKDSSMVSAFIQA